MTALSFPGTSDGYAQNVIGTFSTTADGAIMISLSAPLPAGYLIGRVNLAEDDDLYTAGDVEYTYAFPVTGTDDWRIYAYLAGTYDPDLTDSGTFRLLTDGVDCIVHEQMDNPGDDVTLAHPYRNALTGGEGTPIILMNAPTPPVIAVFDGFQRRVVDWDQVSPPAGTLVIYTSQGPGDIFDFWYVDADCILPDSGPGLWIDFDLDGFSGTDERTADLMAFTWNRGGTPDLVGGVQPGQATAVLSNAEGQYNPDNASGPFYGKLKPGRPVWFGANADGTLSGTADPVYGLFSGFLREISPIPAAGSLPDSTPTVQMLFEDPLGWYSRQQVHVGGSVTRSQRALREAVLAAIPETRLDLDNEISTLPYSSADTQDALGLLTRLNNTNGTRHFVQPAASKDAWYLYTTRNRQYKLGAGADETFTGVVLGDGLTAFNGWRVTDDPIINSQQASIEPVDFLSALGDVWISANPAIAVSSTTPVSLIADYGDFTLDPAVMFDASGAVSVALTNFGTAGRIDITSASTGACLNLKVIGHRIIRQPGITVTATDGASVSEYGTRTGVALSGPLLGAQASAQGIVDALVWRFAQPLQRPMATITNALDKVFPLRLYDLVAVTVAQLSVTDRLLEIVGLTGRCIRAAGDGGSPGPMLWEHDFQLQEARLQSPFQFFTADVSTSDGPDVLAY